MIKRVTQGLGALVTNSYLGYSRSSREDLGEIAPIVETDRLRGSPLFATDGYKLSFTRVLTLVPRIKLVFAQRLLSGFSVRRKSSGCEPKLIGGRTLHDIALRFMSSLLGPRMGYLPP